MVDNKENAGKTHRSVSKKRVQEFITMARKLGLKSLKVGEIEFELSPVSTLKAVVDKAPKRTQAKTEDITPTDDELLYWSGPDFGTTEQTK